MLGGSLPNCGALASKPEPVETRIGVVIVNYRTPHLAKACLQALSHERLTLRNLSAVLVDGGSADGSAQDLYRTVQQREFADWVEVLPLPLNGGFGWANNQAIHRLVRRRDPPEYIYLLNPDAEVEPCAVVWLAEYLDNHPRVAAVGSQLLEADGHLTGSAFRFPSVMREFARGARTGVLEQLFGIKSTSITSSEAVEVDWVTGASVMFRTEALRQVRLFDEGFFLYHEEVELMWRLRHAGWAIATQPRSRVRHVGGAATGVSGSDEKITVPRRNPAYLYRSRTRFFGLTRGRAGATLAFLAWLAGYSIWKLRQLLRLAPGRSPIEREWRDHVKQAFPRHHDFEPAAPDLEGENTSAPAWMINRWL